MRLRLRVFGATLCLLWVSVAVFHWTFARDARTAIDGQRQADVELRLALLRERLSVEPRALARGPEWDRTAQALAAAAQARVVLLDASGARFADSEPDETRATGVPVDAGRPEVDGALRRGMAVLLPDADDSDGTLRGASVWSRHGKVEGVVRIEVAGSQLTAARLLGALTVSALLASGVLAFLITIAVSKLNESAARRLTHAASKLAAGDLSVRIGAQGNDALSVVGKALDALAEGHASTLRELHAEKDKLDRVLSSMNEGVLLVDPEGKVQLVNSAVVEMLSLPPNSVGKRVTELIDDEGVKELLQQALSGASQTIDINLSKPSVRKILASARMLPRQGGVLAVLVDNTEQHRLQNVRQEFVANASHELRTPIAAIISAVETLETVANISSDAARGFVEMISRNAQRLKTLVDDLLALSQIESRVVKIDPEAIPLRRSVENIMNDFSNAARAKGTELVCLVPSDIVVVAAQRGLQHVLGNLVDNAIKYTPPGSRVTVHAARQGDHAAISVRDNGPGIASEHRERIFERFYRVDTGRSRALGGTGLGLSIAKHWVESMDGTITVDSDTSGTVFTVSLPLAEAS